MDIQIQPIKQNGEDIIKIYRASHSLQKPTDLIGRSFKHVFVAALSPHDITRFNNGHLKFSVSHVQLISSCFELAD